jgi:hypothetical protein
MPSSSARFARYSPPEPPREPRRQASAPRPPEIGAPGRQSSVCSTFARLDRAAQTARAGPGDPNATVRWLSIRREEFVLARVDPGPQLRAVAVDPGSGRPAPATGDGGHGGAEAFLRVGARPIIRPTRDRLAETSPDRASQPGDRRGPFPVRQSPVRPSVVAPTRSAARSSAARALGAGPRTASSRRRSHARCRPDEDEDEDLRSGHACQHILPAPRGDPRRAGTARPRGPGRGCPSERRFRTMPDADGRPRTPWPALEHR